METNFDYKSVPYAFVHCFNSQCPKAENCLRHLAAQHCTNIYPTLNIVNPNCISADANECTYFLSTEKIRVAWGTRHLLDNVPYKDVYDIKSRLMGHFGRGKYYRFFRKERYLKPEDQAYIRQVFRQKGIKEEPVFECYSEEYKW